MTATEHERREGGCLSVDSVNSDVTESAVHLPSGGHVNVLSGYKETVLEKNKKFLHNHCNHVIDILIKCCQKHICLALLKCKNG